ncbi:MAG: protease inhibitor I42 family protein [Actinomycetota bacterium]|nr:protease inhibitor I42 family protein [Actinomycetota bacterium]
MRTRLTYVLLATLAVAAVVLAGCRSSDVVKIGVDDEGSIVKMRQDQTLDVSLPANPSTGYNWTVADDGGVLTLVGEPDFQLDSNAIGAPGILTMHLEPSGTGEGSLRLEYRRSWETTQPAQDAFTVGVVVTE